MIQAGTVVKVTDKTGVVMGRCIKVLNSKRIAKMGELVLISVIWINAKRLSFMKERKRKRFMLGRLHRALVVRSKVYIQRAPGVYLRFDENACVIVTKKIVPLSNRVYGPVLKEFCMRWPSLGCVSIAII